MSWVRAPSATPNPRFAGSHLGPTSTVNQRLSWSIAFGSVFGSVFGRLLPSHGSSADLGIERLSSRFDSNDRLVWPFRGLQMILVDLRLACGQSGPNVSRLPVGAIKRRCSATRARPHTRRRSRVPPATQSPCDSTRHTPRLAPAPAHSCRLACVATQPDQRLHARQT